MRLVTKVLPLIVALAVFALLVVWTSGWGHLEVRLALAIICALLAGLWALAPATARKKNIQANQRYLPRESLVRQTRKHVFQTYPCLVTGLLGLAMFVLAFYLRARNVKVSMGAPSLHLGLPTSPPSTKATSPIDIGGPAVSMHDTQSHSLWYVPLVVAIVLILVTLVLFEKWRCTVLVLTDQRLIDKQYMSALVPIFVWSRFSPTQLTQLYDADDEAGFIPSIFGWGTILLKVRTVSTSDRDETRKIFWVPNAEDFSDAIKRYSPQISTPHGSPMRPYDPLDNPPPHG